MGKLVDLTGQKFGRLTVIERAENKERGRGKQACWLCACECGSTKVISGYNLRSGRTKSCGCLQIEKVKEQWQDEDFKKMKSEEMKQLNEEQWQNKDFRKMRSEQMEEQWQDEDLRKIQSEKMKERWQDKDFRKTQSERSKEMWKDEDLRKMQSEKMKERWQDEEIKWKMGYKGGITTISMHLRDLSLQWYNDCKQKANYTCQLTGKHGCKLNTHHLKAFSTIVLEAHNLHNIQIKDQVKNYTPEELKLLEEYVASWHKDNSNAVVLSEDVHRLFHQEYGKGNNTPEQYIEFKERYLAGEFKEILK